MSLFAGSNRTKFESAAYTALLLAFFFAVGLAGGVLYRVLPTNKAQEQQVEEAPPAIAQATPTPAPVVAPTPAPAPAPTPAKSVTPPPPPAKSQVTAAVPPQPEASSATPPSTKMASAPTPAASKPAESTPPAKPAAAPDHATSEAVDAAKPPAPHAKPTEAAKAPKATVATAQPPKPPVTQPAASPASAPAATAEGGSFRIQFGAYSIEDNAHRTQWAVEATGLPVEVIQAPSRKGHVLYYVRSQPFPDRAAALSAATEARDKAHKFTHPVTIDFVVMSDAMISAEQGQTKKP